MSSIRGADSILVLDGGRAIGQGTHEELMRDCPVYRDIAVTQMGAEEGAGREPRPQSVAEREAV